jgi:sugar phosphate isomerase/epimerase
MGADSVQLYSVREQFAGDPKGTLDRLAAIGFTQVEPYGLLDNAAALKSGLPAAGLTAPTTHMHLVDVDQDQVFTAAADLGIGIVIEPAIREDQWRADAGAIADLLNAAAAKAAGYGLRVGYHNHWWELQTKVGDRHALEVMAERLDPAVVLEVDTYWSTAGGADTPALLRRLGGKVAALHVKDGNLATNPSGQVPAGQGRMPIMEVLAAAPDALRVVEFDQYDGDIFEGLTASFTYLAGEKTS